MREMGGLLDDHFLEITLIPSLSCMATYFISCIAFDMIAANKYFSKKYKIQKATETPEKIREACEQFQAGWTPAERETRSHFKHTPASTPVVKFGGNG